MPNKQVFEKYIRYINEFQDTVPILKKKSQIQCDKII